MQDCQINKLMKNTLRR